MDKLNEIFKTNPALLDEPEVKELIEYSKEQYSKVYKRWKEHDDFMDHVLHQCMNSEIILKQGRDSRDVIKSILNYIEKTGLI